MDIIAAYREVGTYRGAASMTGATHKTVKRVIARHEARWRCTWAGAAGGEDIHEPSPSTAFMASSSCQGPSF